MKDGGPAFPLQPTSDPDEFYPGMSMRQWYAGQVLPAVYAQCVGSSVPAGQTWAEMVADEAFFIADAMMRRGERP